MEVSQVLHMTKGDGETSYYKNSTNQQRVLLKARHYLDERIAQVLENTTAECLVFADLGCSSGPNTLLPLWEFIETIDSICSKSNKKQPLLQAFLNDLPNNDYNTIFGSLVPEFHVKLEEKFKHRTPDTCLIGAMPGSFYTKLFPKNSVHFVHSSCAIQWFSQIPEGLVTEDGDALNKGHICLTKASPPIVHEIYSNQFKKDLTKFLKLRSEEVISGGGMVLTLPAGSTKNPYGNTIIWELACLALQDMVNEGKLTQFMLDSFNIPVSIPSLEDVRSTVENEGSFDLNRLEEFEIGWDVMFAEDKVETLTDKALFITKATRAVGEAMLASHFGNAITEEVFERLPSKAEAYIQENNGFTHYFVISLTKK